MESEYVRAKECIDKIAQTLLNLQHEADANTLWEAIAEHVTGYLEV